MTATTKYPEGKRVTIEFDGEHINIKWPAGAVPKTKNMADTVERLVSRLRDFKTTVS